MEGKVASLLDRLRARATAEEIPFQQLLSLFCQEEFLRRPISALLGSLLRTAPKGFCPPNFWGLTHDSKLAMF